MGCPCSINTQGKTLSPQGARSSLIYDTTYHLHQSESILLMLYFQALICNELSVLSSFFFQPLKVCLSKRNTGQICLNIFSWFILLFTYSSPRRKDQFAVLCVSFKTIHGYNQIVWVSCAEGVLLILLMLLI